MNSDSRITFVSVGWTSTRGTDMTIGLALLAKHCRPERVEELIEDLTLMCEEVEAGCRPEDAGRVLSVIQGFK